VDKAASSLQARSRGEQRLDDCAVTDKNELNAGMTGKRQFRPRHDHGSPMVSPHSVERDPDLMGH
jgi:hypothetical protein